MPRGTGKCWRNVPLWAPLTAMPFSYPAWPGMSKVVPTSIVFPLAASAARVGCQNRSVAAVQRGIAVSGKMITRAADDNANCWTKSAACSSASGEVPSGSRPPNFVLTASQVAGTLGAPGYGTLQPSAAAAMTSAESLGRINSRGIAKAVKPNPNQPVPGKRMPAAVSGDATPIIPSRGTTVARTAAVERIRKLLSFKAQSRAYGAHKSAAPHNQMQGLSIRPGFGPKKVLAPGITSQVADA